MDNHEVWQKTEFSGLYIREFSPYHDERGLFSKVFDMQNCASLLDGTNVCQVNISTTKSKGSVRGLHFQYPPYAEHKIITCVRGAIWDVVVDMRRHSRTFMQHFTITMEQKNSLSLLVPPGFAHGFQTLTDDAELIYAHTKPYVKEYEGGLNVLDKALNISWPLEVKNLSERDKNHPLLKTGSSVELF
ncbi:dTDP-4-dehydrorhamnose 3,5-epimerase family protein [Alphaproteobacteria bacterium]|nr:dTDP-4-dehydrorhamnose 3,5-epimerase family protein [Alphaproteobacteria bacterium]